MKNYYPDYYREFVCIAADCPDSCCRGWDIVIDESTEAYYNTVQGYIGDKLRASIYTDADGDRVFRLSDDKKCPFWGSDRLCDIYRELGEERLCETCARFPRLTMDYTAFCEHSLALACPEAARLIASADGAYSSFDLTDISECDDYSPELMSLLLRSRRECADILSSDIPLAYRLTKFLNYNAELQKALTGYEAEVSSASTLSDIARLYSRLEYIDAENRDKLSESLTKAPDISQNEAELSRLSLYWLYRYYLMAVDSADVLSPAAFTVCSVITTAALSEKYGLSVGSAAQLYSKEIEQSYENTELIYDALATDERLSAEALAELLCRIYNTRRLC